MAKKTISKNDYDAAWSVINYKNGYESGKAQGLSGYEKNHTDAQPHYDYLKENNPELYNMLMTSDYKTAVDAMQNQYTLEYTPTETASSNNTFLQEKADEGFGTYNMMHTDPTYGQEIRDAFSAYGKSEGNQAAAGAAADNGGNFGSFADYNKKNTELAYKVAGENAVQAKRDGYATGFSKIYTSVSDGLNDSSGQFLNYDYQTKKIEADERMNQDDNETILAGYEKDKHVSDNTLKGNMYAADTQKEISFDTNDTNKEIAEINAANKDNTSVETAYEALYDAGISTEEEAIAYLIEDGYSEEEAKNIATTYMPKRNNGEFDSSTPKVAYEDMDATALYNALEEIRVNFKDSDIGDDEWYKYALKLKGFIADNIKDNKSTLSEANIRQHILNNAAEYHVSVEHAEFICEKLGIDTSWLMGYKNEKEGGVKGNEYMVKITDDTTAGTTNTTSGTTNTTSGTTNTTSGTTSTTAVTPANTMIVTPTNTMIGTPTSSPYPSGTRYTLIKDENGIFRLVPVTEEVDNND